MTPNNSAAALSPPAETSGQLSSEATRASIVKYLSANAELFKDTEDDTEHAWATLCRMGPGYHGWLELRSALDNYVRAHPESVDELLANLTTRSIPEIPALWAHFLPRIGRDLDLTRRFLDDIVVALSHPDATAALEPYLPGLLRTNDPKLRSGVLRYMAGTSRLIDLPWLTNEVRDHEEWEALFSTLELGVAALGPGVIERIADTTVSEFRRDPSGRLAYLGLGALKRYNRPLAQMTLARLLASDPPIRLSPELTAHFLQTIGVGDGKEGVSKLIQLANDAGDGDSRSAYLLAVERVRGAEPTHEDIVPFLIDPDWRVRSVAARLTRDLPSLTRLAASDVDAVVRCHAADRIATLGNPETATRLLEEIMLSHPSILAREVALEYLSVWSPRERFETFIQSYQPDDVDRVLVERYRLSVKDRSFHR